MSYFYTEDDKWPDFNSPHLDTISQEDPLLKVGNSHHLKKNHED